MTARPDHAPHAAELEAMARAAFARIPEPFSEHLRDIIVRVEDFADQDVLDRLGIEDRWGLSGLYHGHPLGQQSIWASGDMPPVITLYRMPIIAELRQTGIGLQDLVTHVVVHEVGHHFGFSDEDMAALERPSD
ncbi:MAG: metallopeptidase family protein [Sphingomonadaceae bacterium]|nr:metallopeptidase family protein [Sphingomonadaceae bacterium]